MLPLTVQGVFDAVLEELNGGIWTHAQACEEFAPLVGVERGSSVLVHFEESQPPSVGKAGDQGKSPRHLTPYSTQVCPLLLGGKVEGWCARGFRFGLLDRLSNVVVLRDIMVVRSKSGRCIFAFRFGGRDFLRDGLEIHLTPVAPASFALAGCTFGAVYTNRSLRSVFYHLGLTLCAG